MIEPDIQLDLFCPACGYNLRGIESDRCPECGLAIDRSTLVQSSIPWLHRKQIGRFRAFWRTVNLVTLHPGKLANEMNCPARFADAVKFRNIAVLCASMPLAIILVDAIWNSFDPKDLWLPADRAGSVMQLGTIGVYLLCLMLFLFAVSGVASYCFHPRSLSVIKQNRAVALSYYAFAPAAYTPFTIFVVYVGYKVGAQYDAVRVPIQTFVVLPSLVTSAFQFALLLWIPAALLGVLTHCGRLRRTAMVLAIILSWGVIGGAMFFAVPWAWDKIVIMVLSLRP